MCYVTLLPVWCASLPSPGVRVCVSCMAAHIPRQQWNTCLRVLCALPLYKYKTKKKKRWIVKTTKSYLQPNTNHLMIHTFFPFIHLTHLELKFLMGFLFVFHLYTRSSPPSDRLPFHHSTKSLSFCLWLSVLHLWWVFTENWLSPTHAGHSSFWRPSVWRGWPRCCWVWRKHSGQPWCWGTPPLLCRGEQGRCRHPLLPWRLHKKAP